MEFDEIDRAKVIGATKARMLKIGHYIKNIRMLNQMTQQDLAFYIFSDKSLISELERGIRKNITLSTLMKISEVFNVEVEVLVAG